MPAKYILIVDDERPIREMMSFWLQRHGFAVAEAADADSARLSIAHRRPDLMLLDWMLPRMSGLELARLLRASRLTSNIAIIMVTACVDEEERVTALNGGADDYLAKPFAPRELLARINAVLRRSRQPYGLNGREPDPKPAEAGGLVLDASRQCVHVGAHTVQLSPTDFRLLEFFIENAERAHSRSQLLDHVWGGSSRAEERTVDVQIQRLRKTLEPFACDRFIQTVRGAGYRFSTRVD